PRADAQAGVLHERADALGGGDAAGLAQQLDVDPARVERLDQSARERRLAGPVEPLDRDQPAAHGGRDDTGAARRYPRRRWPTCPAPSITRTLARRSVLRSLRAATPRTPTCSMVRLAAAS